MDGKQSPEIAAAYREAKSRGLPDGWTCSIDKRKRRKWLSPDGRSCDSIPKALHMSVELGLLPPDFVIPGGTKRRRVPSSKSKNTKRRPSPKSSQPKGAPPEKAGRRTASLKPAPPTDEISEEDESSDESEKVDEEDGEIDPMDPDTSLDGMAASTVHWDPQGLDGRKVGWKCKVETSPNKWVEGRIANYDPYTHKHLIVAKTRKAWVWLRNRQHNIRLATRIVWALVKGYAWWPALIYEGNDPEERKTGFVQVEFFKTGDISKLRDSEEIIRPFSPDFIDPVVAKHKKKRNKESIDLAKEECFEIQRVRNRAAVWYATKAFHLVNLKANSYLGKSVKIFRSDINYPYGETVVGRVKGYSTGQKKWLLTFEPSDGQSQRYPACWINLMAKEVSLRLVDKNEPDISTEDVLPFIYGFQSLPDEDSEEHVEISTLLESRCHSCVEAWGDDDIQCVCSVCDSKYHLACVDPPMSSEVWHKMLKDGAKFVCSRCITCKGCYGKDICFGSQLHPPPVCLNVTDSGPLYLCGMCKDAFSENRFCPNCGHSWDDKKRVRIQEQMKIAVRTSRKRKRHSSIAEDTIVPVKFGSFVGDEEWPEGAIRDPHFFHPETSQWGFTEADMLVCDGCKVWLHAGCAGIDKEEYDAISAGRHPVYSKEFLCNCCCRKRCEDLIASLNDHDRSGIFAVPVTEKVAPNYKDVIKHPMDLFTMSQIFDNQEHADYVWVREKFELMVLNALMFNKNYSAVWHEAKRYFNDCIRTVFKVMAKAAPPSQYYSSIMENFEKFEEERKKEAERVQVDEDTEKKDLVAGSIATSTKLPKLRDCLPDIDSCVPCTEVKLNPTDAFFSSWMESCFTCGSSGAMDTMMYCVDCGEAYHSFCANAPIRGMDGFSEAGWRCPNCKVCEISGDVPADETKMLFCEMCDRAFNIDLIDPPLGSAPPGLWICGQCVECKGCQGSCDSKGACLTHWSTKTEKCYRCGGCDGLIDEQLAKKKCLVCSKLFRSDDRLARCKKCQAQVHVECDPRAEGALARVTQNSEHNFRSQKSHNARFECSSCSPGTQDSHSFKRLIVSMAKERIPPLWKQQIDAYTPGLGYPSDSSKVTELFGKLVEAHEWECRNQKREKYQEVLEEAMRVYRTASARFGDARLVVQHIQGTLGHSGIPFWTSQRALRFIWVARRSKWANSEHISMESIVSLVNAAKLGASFVLTAAQVLCFEVQSLPCHEYVFKLMVPPNNTSIYMYPVEEYDITVDDLATSISEIEVKISGDPPTQTRREKAITSKALCGWNHLPQVVNERVWKDSRECSFCHLRGDDDAGLQSDLDRNVDGSEYPFPSLGRLLPMANGHWVHTLCAMWSSEVFESPKDGMLHAVEKARARGAQLKCFGCGRPGATVGCNKSNCSYNFHVGCAKVSGAVFTVDQKVFCKNHTSSASRTLPKPGHEYMKAIVVAPEDKKTVVDSAELTEGDLCFRLGALTVHALGEIEQNLDGFHSEDYLTPPGFMATRIFWSGVEARTRTVYVLKIDRAPEGTPEFSVIPGDDPDGKIVGSRYGAVYDRLMNRVQKLNAPYFRERGNLYSKLPSLRRKGRKTFGLNGAQFFGFGVSPVRRRLESLPGVEAAVAKLHDSSPMYKFCFVQPTVDAILDLQRKRAASRAEQALENNTGCARSEGMTAFARSGGSGRITRALVRSAEDAVVESSSASAKTNVEEKAKAKADRNRNQVKYRQMKAVPLEERLAARRSHIHGWGLFTKLDIPKDDPIIEYMGEVIRQPVADQRERAYEVSGEGSCYMFRLDLNRIVDATKIGCMARFMNHCCQPNAYAKIITVDTEVGDRKALDRKIVVFANRHISAGEEITYDYKFPVEDGSLRCTCGAPNCIGRLN